MELLKRHQPLYLKYRPQSLGELVGQEAVTRTLTNAINHNRLSHAYLLTGPRGTGKTSSARILAKSLNCKTAGKPTAEPCQTCSCCEEITLGNSPAVFEIDAASNNSVDDARVLIERAPLKAVGGEYKVYIIDECHMLSKEAFNALLKTIEQPPPGLIFILATTEEHKVLPTIVSRCQRLMFRLIPQEPLVEHLRNVAAKENIEIEEEALRLIARRSGGGLRDALGHLDQASLLAAPGEPATVTDLLRLLGALHEDLLLDISRQILSRDGQQIINSVNIMLTEGREPAVIVQELGRHFLNILKAAYLSSGNSVNLEMAQQLILGSEQYLQGLLELAPQFERSELSQIVEALDRLEQSCRRTSQPAMHLEMGLLSICHRHEMLLVREFSERLNRIEKAVSSGAPITQISEPQKERAAYKAPPQQYKETAKPQEPVMPASAPVPPVAAVSPVVPASSVAAEAFDKQEQSPKNEPQSDLLSVEEDSSPESISEAQDLSVVVSQVLAAVEQSEVSESEPEAESFNGDIDHLWSQILDELQRRHIPTFSLASTHAFPLSANAKEISLGVLKENFQKMLEQKIEHLKAACQAVLGESVTVRIRVAESETKALAPAKSPATRAALNTRDTSEKKVVDLESSVAVEKNSNTTFLQSDKTELQSERKEEYPETDAPKLSESESAPIAINSEFDSTMVKEAYKLFDGPGSRRIQ